MCLIRHCLDWSVSLNSCQQLICIAKADVIMCIFWGEFVHVCGCSTDSELRYLLGNFESMYECHSADKPRHTVQHSDNAQYTFTLAHLPHTATVFDHETNCSCTKLQVTAVCYRDSRTDSIHRFSPISEIQQKATAGPTSITNWTFRGSSTIQL